MKIFCMFLFPFISIAGAQQMPDPFKGLENLADKVVQGVDNLGQGVMETLSPAAKLVGNVDKAILGGINGGLNKGIFSVEKGLVNKLSEVIGTPINLQDVQFFLATFRNFKTPIKVDYSNPAEVANTTTKVFLIIHGWGSSSNESWVGNLTEVLLMRYPESHVVQVDWSKPAHDEYAVSSFNTEKVGEIVSNLTQNLVSNHSVPTENIIFIGHSLGAHISGWAARRFKNATGKKLPLIVGLDPAGPLFCLRPEHRRLNKNDAKRVMVIHTDGGQMGFLEPCGTIDFFPNGGSFQPGCAKINVINPATYLNPLSCNHVRSHDLIVEAINSTKAFPAKRCNSYTGFILNLGCEDVKAHMGFLNEDNNGSFYLMTSSSPPFSLPLKPTSGAANTSSGNNSIGKAAQIPQNNTDIILTLHRNDKIYIVGNDIVIDIPDRNDTRVRVQGKPGDTIVYADKGTTVKTTVESK